MKTTIAALLALALLAGPAAAADGEGAGPVTGGTAKAACGDKAGKDCGGCKEKGAGQECGEECEEGDDDCCEDATCAECVEGLKVGKACCVAKKAAADLQVVTLALLHGEGDGAKAVLAAVPAESAPEVEKARADAWTGLVKVSRAIEKTKAECKTACDEAKAEGKEASCEVTSAYEADLAALGKKARAILDGLSATVKTAVGEDKVAGLAVTVRKGGDVAKVVMEKVRAEAAAAEAGEESTGEPAPKKAGECSSGST